MASDAAPPAATLDEIDRLVVRVALYPDPLLALVLQASTVPLDVVVAARFVEKRAKDSTLQPDPDWDSSVIGLLNYASVLTMMSDDLIAASPVAANKLNRSASPRDANARGSDRVSATPSPRRAADTTPPRRAADTARPAATKAAARPGDERASGRSGGVGDVRPAKDVRKEAQRGAQSRAAVQEPAGSRKSLQAPERAAKQQVERRNRSSGSAFAQAGRGDRGQRAANRGAQSRAGGGGRGGRGR